MPLPKLNDQPKYEVTIPSTERVVKFRPYLVKEEKVLMMALESKENKKALGAIVDTIDACVQDDIETDKLTTFDVEYMFTQIRSKSVGETSKIGLVCPECNKQTDVEIPISEVVVTKPEVENTIKLTKDISLQMRWPCYKELMDLELDPNKPIESFKMVGKCIESVQTAEENIMLKDETDDEVMNFIESLTNDQFAKIRTYVEKMPKMEHKIEWTCQCNKKQERTLSGINDFF